MLGFLKKVLGLTPKQVENVPFSVLDIWFQKKLRENSTIARDLTRVLTELGVSFRVLEKNINSLSTKRLKPEIPEEHKKVIDDHKNGFVNKMQNFISQMVVPEQKTFSAILSYGEMFSVSFTRLNQNMGSQLKSLGKIFPNDAQAIADTLESITNQKDSLMKLIRQEHGVSFIHDIKKSIKDIEKKQKVLSDFKQQIERELQKKKETEENMLRLETDFDNLKTSSEYEKYDQLVSNKFRLEKELERESVNLRTSFATISSVLIRIEGPEQALARQYADDPIKTLENDRNLWILNLLQTVSVRLPDLVTDEVRRMKMREALSLLSHEQLKNFLKKKELINTSLNQTHRQIMLNTTTTKIEDLKYKLSHAKEQIMFTEDNKHKYQKLISEQDSEKDLLMLEKKLNTFAGIKII